MSDELRMRDATEEVLAKEWFAWFRSLGPYAPPENTELDRVYFLDLVRVAVRTGRPPPSDSPQEPT